MAETAPPMTDEEPEDLVGEDTKAYLAELKTRLDPPGDIEKLMNDAQELREYVHTQAMLRDTDDTVGTNLVLRNMRVALNQFVPSSPEPRVSPKPRLLPMEVPSPLDPADSYLARTHQLLLAQQQDDADFVGQMRAAARAAMTTGLGILKLRWQEDFTKDSIGYSRINDSQDSVARYQALRMAWDNGDFSEDSAQHKMMTDLEPIVRKRMASDLAEDLAETPPPAALDALGNPMVNENGEPIPEADPRQQQIDDLQAGSPIDLTELPELDIFQGPALDVIDLEDFRWDWAITRPEDFYKAEWMAHRVFYYPDQIRDKWGVDMDELREANFYDETGKVVKTSEEDNERDGVDQTMMGCRVAVWEYWDRVQFRVVVWVEGMGRFVSEQIPDAATKRFFPFYLIALDPVDGRLIPVSQVYMQKGLQDDYNKLRTWDQELLRGSLPKFLIDQALLGNNPRRVAQELEEALPFSFTPIQSPGELAASIFTVTPQRYDPTALEHTRQLTLFDSQLVAGIPTAALGAAGGASLATEAAIGNEQMGVQVDNRRAVITETFRLIYQDVMELNAQLLPEVTVKKRVGEGAVWPPMSINDILGSLRVEAHVAPEDGPARRQELQQVLLLAQIFQQFGLGPFLNPIEAAKLAAETAGLQGDASRLLASPLLVQALAALTAQAGGQGQSPQGQGQRPPTREQMPDAQGGRGQEGGRPQTTEPPRPESVPNNPLA